MHRLLTPYLLSGALKCHSISICGCSLLLLTLRGALIIAGGMLDLGHDSSLLLLQANDQEAHLRGGKTECIRPRGS